MKTLFTLIASALLLSACATGAPVLLAQMEGPELAQQKTEHICFANLFSPRPAYVAELVRRGAVDQKDAEAVATKRVYIGMPEAAARCSWGEPDRINTATTSYGTGQQWVYRNQRVNGYLYIVEGRVTGIQN